MEIDLKNELSKKEFSRKDKILLILTMNNNGAKRVVDITNIGIENGLREISKWNISMILSNQKSLCTKIKDGWILTAEGIDYVKTLNISIVGTPLKNSYTKLEESIQDISSDYIKKFINEAILSLEYGLLRSSVVFSWIGAISILYEYVLAKKIIDFNTEAKRRFPKWANANSVDGLTKMKEYDFLQVIEGIAIIGKNTKNELEKCLQLRNSCGHPSTLEIGEHTVASHLEILIMNVYKKFC